MLSKRAMRGRKDRQIDEERLTGKAGQLDDALHTHARARQVCTVAFFRSPLSHESRHFLPYAPSAKWADSKCGSTGGASREVTTWHECYFCLTVVAEFASELVFQFLGLCKGFLFCPFLLAVKDETFRNLFIGLTLARRQIDDGDNVCR